MGMNRLKDDLQVLILTLWQYIKSDTYSWPDRNRRFCLEKHCCTSPLMVSSIITTSNKVIWLFVWASQVSSWVWIFAQGIQTRFAPLVTWSYGAAVHSVTGMLRFCFTNLKSTEEHRGELMSSWRLLMLGDHHCSLETFAALVITFDSPLREVMSISNSLTDAQTLLIVSQFKQTVMYLYVLKSSSLSLNPLLRSMLIPFSASSASLMRSVFSSSTLLSPGAGSVGSAILIPDTGGAERRRRREGELRWVSLVYLQAE